MAEILSELRSTERELSPQCGATTIEVAGDPSTRSLRSLAQDDICSGLANPMRVATCPREEILRMTLGA